MQRNNERTSFLSGQKGPRGEMLRFVVYDAHLQIDEKGNLPGRGAYLFRQEIPAALVKKAFNRLLKRALSESEEEAIKKAYGKEN